MDDRMIFSRLLGCAQRSKDPSTQNAAALVYKGEIVVYRYNGLSIGVKDRPERWERPQKYLWVEHAERAVLYQALLYNDPTIGGQLHCLWAACADCARAIVGAGISEVITHSKLMDLTPQSWRESIAVGQQILAEGGVKTRQFTGLIGGQIRFGGQLVEI